MNAVISVVGKDCVGILAKVSTKCAECNANVVDVTQTVIDGYFTMFMIVNIDLLNRDYNDFGDEMRHFGETLNLQISVMHEDIFNSMHKI